MRKMVVLTEGQTEQLFVAKLIEHIADNAPFKIESKKLYGGRKFETIELEVSAIGNTRDTPEFYILILDCASDGRVVSALKDRYSGFVAQNYQQMVIVRDVRPDFDFDEVGKAFAGITRQLPETPVSPVVVLATMEIEAWFISELSHFSKIDGSLDIEALNALGLNENSKFEEINEPASQLGIIYNSVGVEYGKSKSDVERTVSALDISLFLADLKEKIPSIKPLVAVAMDFFSSPVPDQTPDPIPINEAPLAP